MEILAVIAEPVIGSTLGVVTAPAGYFTAVRRVCDKYGALLIYDEVMCGMGRKCLRECLEYRYLQLIVITGMGSLHAFETCADGVAPDISAVAKGLAGG